MLILVCAIFLKRKRKLVTLLLLSYRCIITINVLWLFLTVPLVCLQYVIVAFPDHTHLLFGVSSMYKEKCLHKVLVNHLVNRKSVVRLTDHPNMTIAY